MRFRLATISCLKVDGAGKNEKFRKLYTSDSLCGFCYYCLLFNLFAHFVGMLLLLLLSLQLLLLRLLLLRLPLLFLLSLLMMRGSQLLATACCCLWGEDAVVVTAVSLALALAVVWRSSVPLWKSEILQKLDKKIDEVEKKIEKLGSCFDNSPAINYPGCYFIIIIVEKMMRLRTINMISRDFFFSYC